MSDVPWWSRPGLEVREGRLLLAGRDAELLAREHGTPLFVYDLERTAEQVRSLLGAFERAGAAFRLRMAIKAQRDPRMLAFVRRSAPSASTPARPARSPTRSRSSVSTRGTTLRPSTSSTASRPPSCSAERPTRSRIVWSPSAATSTRATTCGPRTNPFPEVREGDVVAILRVGSYNQAMHLDHCLRPPAGVVAFAERV